MRQVPITPDYHDIPAPLRARSWRCLAQGADGAAWQIGYLRVIASVGMGWEHVSVSTETRTPSWEEMEYVKRAFWEPYETVMQLHVPEAEHVNCHPFCLHLWRPLWTEGKIPRPPNFMVGGG